jgi:hypothetical protein
LTAQLDRLLAALHRQYSTNWSRNVGRFPNSLHPTSPVLLNDENCGSIMSSLQPPFITPPDSSILSYHPSFAAYAIPAFKEFRSILATFRRVQSQLSPSLAITSSAPIHVYLPINRCVSNGDSVATLWTPDTSTFNDMHSEQLNTVTMPTKPPKLHRPMTSTGTLGEYTYTQHRSRPGHSNGNSVNNTPLIEPFHGYEGVVLVPSLHYVIP